ncbi:MAG: hypothetical protein ACLTCI_05535 [[Clostridium] nexile]
MPTKGQQHFFNLSGNESLKNRRLRYVDNIAICETTWFTTAFNSLQQNLNGSLYAILQNEYNIRQQRVAKPSSCACFSEEAEL